MSKGGEATGLFDALAESVLSSSDEELAEDIRDSGKDPDSVAEETRSLLTKTLKDFRQRPHQGRWPEVAVSNCALPEEP